MAIEYDPIGAVLTIFVTRAVVSFAMFLGRALMSANLRNPSLAYYSGVISTIAIGLLLLLTVPSSAQSNPALRGCVYPSNVAEQTVAERIMALPLPYLDKEFIFYRDDSGQPVGSYAVRRSLRIYFYDKNNVLLGTAVRRSQELTSYFDPNGSYLGVCINHKLVRPDQHPVHFEPGSK